MTYSGLWGDGKEATAAQLLSTTRNNSLYNPICREFPLLPCSVFFFFFSNSFLLLFCSLSLSPSAFPPTPAVFPIQSQLLNQGVYKLAKMKNISNRLCTKWVYRERKKGRYFELNGWGVTVRAIEASANGLDSER